MPTLRFMTQAGRADAARRGSGPGSSAAGSGASTFFVMYGQTEATARMAYLPPALAAGHPQAIGRAIPGGHLELRPVDGAPDGVGELVYRGPNVMLGYATEQADLALGAHRSTSWRPVTSAATTPRTTCSRSSGAARGS